MPSGIDYMKVCLDLRKMAFPPLPTPRATPPAASPTDASPDDAPADALGALGIVNSLSRTNIHCLEAQGIHCAYPKDCILML